MLAIIWLEWRQHWHGKRLWLLAVFALLPLLLLLLIQSNNGFERLEEIEQPSEAPAAELLEMDGFPGPRGVPPGSDWWVYEPGTDRSYVFRGSESQWYEVRYESNYDASAALSTLFTLLVQVLAPLAALLFGASILASDSDRGTIGYLWTRSMSRGSVLLAKTIGIWLLLLPAVLLPAGLGYVIAGTPFGVATMFTFLAALVLSLTSFLAVFVLFGSWTKKSGIPVALGYGLGWELILGSLSGVNQLTISHHLRGIVALGSDELPTEGFAAPEIGVVAILVPVIVTVVLMLIATRRINHVEFGLSGSRFE